MSLNYYDYGEVVKAFWSCNIKQDYSNFDFIQAFESFESLIYSKVAEHGLLSFEDFKESQEEFYNYDCLNELQQITDYIQITKEDLKEALLKYKYEINKKEFKNSYYSNLNSLKEVYDKIQKAKNNELTKKEMVFLFDEVIHTEHETGLIFEDYFNLDDLRKEFEDNLIKLKGGIKE